MFKDGDIVECLDATAGKNYGATLRLSGLYKVNGTATTTSMHITSGPESWNVNPNNFTLASNFKSLGPTKVPKTKKGLVKKGYMAIYATALGKTPKLTGGLVFKTEEEAEASCKEHTSLIDVVEVSITVPPTEELNATAKSATTVL
jgi:hypothetical protein